MGPLGEDWEPQQHEAGSIGPQGCDSPQQGHRPAKRSVVGTQHAEFCHWGRDCGVAWGGKGTRNLIKCLLCTQKHTGAHSRRLLFWSGWQPSSFLQKQHQAFPGWEWLPVPHVNPCGYSNAMLTVTGLEKGLRFSSESQFQDACRAIRKEKALLPLEMLADDFHIIQERDKANPEESCAKRARYSNTFLWVLDPAVPEARTTPGFFTMGVDKFPFWSEVVSEYSFCTCKQDSPD